MNNLLANHRLRTRYNFPTHLKKSLGLTGTIKVGKGQEVAPHDILGTFQSQAGFFSVNLAKRLHVSPVHGSEYLKKNLGTNIYKGELLASKKGLFGDNNIISPTDGTLDAYDTTTGELRIKFFPKEITVTSGVYGIIDHIDSYNREVWIKTFMTEIFGIEGSGKQRSGVLEIIDGSSNLLNPNQLQKEMAGHILVVGALAENEAFQKALQFGISGLITGGMNFHDFKPFVNSMDPSLRQNSDSGITICITEGYGPIPISKDVYDLLNQFKGQFVILEGNPAKISLPTADSNSIISLRKIALPEGLESKNLPEVSSVPIQVGVTVRIIWPPFMGSIGKVIAIDQTASTLDSGVVTYLLTIEIASKKIKVPFTNIEILG